MRSLGQFQTFLFFFYEKILHVQKTQKAQKNKNHKKHKDVTKQKHKNGNKRTSHFLPLRCFLST